MKNQIYIFPKYVPIIAIEHNSPSVFLFLRSKRNWGWSVVNKSLKLDDVTSQKDNKPER